MKCPKCGGRGFLQEYYHYGAKARSIIKQCCDIKAYSRAVQLMSGVPDEAFKEVGRKEPFIGKEMNVTHKGLEIKSGREKKEGPPCRVIPLRPR